MLLRKLFKLRESRQPEEAGDAELVKPFLEHLEDLRWMIVKSLIALAIGMALCAMFRNDLSRLILAPLTAMDSTMANTIRGLGVVDSFTFTIRTAFYGGLISSFPFILYFVAEFVLPALTAEERKAILPALAIGFVLFLIGVVFAYTLVLPRALKFFYDDQRSLGWLPEWNAKDYYAFVTHFTLVFGLGFELPVVVIVLVKIGILSHLFMRNTRAYAAVAIFIVAAVITPTQDFLTLFLLAGPMLILYEACIWIALLIEKKDQSPAPRLEDEE